MVWLSSSHRGSDAASRPTTASTATRNSKRPDGGFGPSHHDISRTHSSPRHSVPLSVSPGWYWPCSMPALHCRVCNASRARTAVRLRPVGRRQNRPIRGERVRNFHFSTAVAGAFRRGIAVASVVVAGLTSGCEKPATPAPPTPEVLVATVEQRDVPVTIELVGQSKGSQDVE